MDVARTAKALAEAITLASGQVCCTATRWVLQERIYDEFVEKVKPLLSAVKIGYGLDPETQMGPVVSEKQRARIQGYLDRGIAAGAKTVVAGGRATVPGYEGGFYVRPALLAGPPDNVCAREEIFGPVAYLLRFRTEEEAVELVNSSDYGLANSVWSRDLRRANRVAEALVAGNSWINAHNVFAHGLLYGGTKVSGLGGGVMGPETLLECYRRQSIARPLEQAPPGGRQGRRPVRARSARKPGRKGGPAGAKR